jgi:hypothetical protein
MTLTFPFYAHRYVGCSSDPSDSTVLSIVVEAVDAIIYADPLQSYLEKVFLYPDENLSR